MPSNKASDEYQKWDYITLSDFTSSSCGTVFSYGWLWFLAIIGVAVYGVDTYTAVNLLAFDKWSSTFQPLVPLTYAKWIFASCILLSWLLLFYEGIRAFRVIKRQNVAESYMDPLAVNFQSMRWGSNGRGWRRFLVFKELTKSKKGADYSALFCYFQFQGAIRVCLAEGPRQVVNGLTIYSIMRANLIPLGSHAASDGHSPFVQFWINVKVLYESSPSQAAVLFSMMFTLFIWLFSAISLIAAAILYMGFLWHYLPKISLNKYCRRKVDKRLARIVNVKSKEALEKGEARRHRDEDALGNAPPGFAMPTRTATLPTLMDDSSSVHPSTLHHSNSISSTVTAPSMFSRNDTTINSERKPTLPNLKGPSVSQMARKESSANTLAPQHTMRPGMPARSGTQLSNTSLSSLGSDRPLLHHAASFDQSISPLDVEPCPERAATNMSRKPLPSRTRTGNPEGQQQWRDPFQPALIRPETAQSLNASGRRTPPDSGPAYEMRPPPPMRRPVPAQFQQQPGYFPGPPPFAQQDRRPSDIAYGAYAPFRQGPPGQQAPGQRPPGQGPTGPLVPRPLQPHRAMTADSRGPPPQHPMDRQTPPPRGDTAPPSQGIGYRRPPPEPLNRGFNPGPQTQRGNVPPWQTPP